MLPKVHRIVKEKDFKQVFRKGKYLSQDLLNLKYVKNNLDKSRFGFTIGLKISKKAVIRNKIKRQMTEIIRHNLPSIKKGFDIVIMPKPAIVDQNYQEIKKILVSLLKKTKIL